MSSYPLNKINTIEIEKLRKGIFLWAFHVDKIPPHVGVSIDGVYFSMKFSDCDFKLDVDTVYQVVQRKKIPAFIIPLKNRGTLDNLQTIFSEYGSKIKDGESCMTPVLRFLGEDEELLLEELLTHLFHSEKLEVVFGLNLASDFKGIPFYTFNQVQLHIQNLKDAKR